MIREMNFWLLLFFHKTSYEPSIACMRLFSPILIEDGGKGKVHQQADLPTDSCTARPRPTAAPPRAIMCLPKQRAYRHRARAPRGFSGLRVAGREPVERKAVHIKAKK